MRMNFKTLRVSGALLVAGALLTMLPLAASAQNGRDFSEGLTGASSMRAGSSESAERASLQAAAEAQAAQALATPSERGSVAPGQMGPGDKVKLTVFGEEELSGEFEVDRTGSLAVPLVGEIKVRGLTAREVEKRIASVLEQGYLKNPRVNIEVMNFRPFFILGEVNKPGSYPYVNDMTVINAVALGGGYTTRAKTGKAVVRRASSPEKEEWAREDELVYPGDVIRVEERFF